MRRQCFGGFYRSFLKVFTLRRSRSAHPRFLVLDPGKKNRSSPEIPCCFYSASRNNRSNFAELLTELLWCIWYHMVDILLIFFSLICWEENGDSCPCLYIHIYDICTYICVCMYWIIDLFVFHSSARLPTFLNEV